MLFRVFVLVLKLQLFVSCMFLLILVALAAHIIPEPLMSRILTRPALANLNSRDQAAIAVIYDVVKPGLDRIMKDVGAESERNHISEMEYLSIIKGIAEANPEMGAKLLTDLQANGIQGVATVLSTVFEGWKNVGNQFLVAILAQECPEALPHFVNETTPFGDEDIPF